LKHITNVGFERLLSQSRFWKLEWIQICLNCISKLSQKSGSELGFEKAHGCRKYQKGWKGDMEEPKSWRGGGL